MTKKKHVLAIIGSAGKDSSNLQLVNSIGKLTRGDFHLTIFDRLSTLPHFSPELSIDKTPSQIIALRDLISNADGILICTPEYIFSIPSGLKNAIEWCVSTTVFAAKPVGLITASANGEKAHEELQLIMKTLETRFTDKTTLLIQGVKGKIDGDGSLTDAATKEALHNFLSNFKQLLYA